MIPTLQDTASNATTTYYPCEDGTTEAQAIAYNDLQWILEGYVQTVINVFGLTANLIAIPVLISKELCNTFNRTLAVLAVFDLLFNVCDLLETRRQLHGTNDLHQLMFPLLRFVQNVSMLASIYTTMVVALERYFAVSKPISAFMDDGSGQKWWRVLSYIAPVFLFAVVFNLPTYFEIYVVSDGLCHYHYQANSTFEVNVTQPIG